MTKNVPPKVDDKTYIRAVKGALPWLQAREQLRGFPQDEGWSAFDLGLDPVNLGLIVVSEEFAEWYKRRFPEDKDTVDEIRGMPEKKAFKEIRKGRWVERARGYDSPDE